MRLKLVADREGRIWGGLSQESDAQWFSASLDQRSLYNDLLGPLVECDPMREASASFSRGKPTRGLDDAVAERRTWLNVFEECVIDNAQSD